MRREYVIRPRSVRTSNDEWHEADAEDYLARTVDIGIMDAEGNPIMARKRMDPIGFVRWPEKG